MTKSFGLDFVLINDTRQMLPKEVFGGGPWVHLATAKRGLKEYCAFQKLGTKKVYIEEVDPTHKNLFKQIESDKEFQDVYQFMMMSNCLTIAGKDIEIKGTKEGLPGFKI